MTTAFESAIGEEVTICHATGTVVSAGLDSYTVEVELAGVTQQVTAAPEYVNERVELGGSDATRREPTKSEPADFGGGESTGVQKL